VAGFAIYGLIRGFAKTFIAMFGTILSILFAMLLCSSVATFLESKFAFVSTISNSLSGTIGNVFGTDAMNIPLSQATELGMREAGVGGILIGIALSIKSGGSYPAGTTIGQVICPTFAYYIVTIISAVCLFIIFELIFIVAGLIIKKYYKIKLVKKLDMSLGCVLGFFSGIIYYETLVMIIGAIPIGAMQDLYVLLQNSTLSYVICLLNPFDSILNLISFDKIANYVYYLIA
jgi:uncharacterized membrane protein required for colicin V production